MGGGQLTVDLRKEGDVTHVTLAGTVDEHSRFDALEGLTGKVQINLKGVRRFNSVGVREWINVIRPLSQRAHLTFVECSPATITQVNMISGFLCGVIRSFYAPMVCEHCETTADQLLDPSAGSDDGVPPMPCPKCGRDMVLDEVEDQYLLFLREPTRVF